MMLDKLPKDLLKYIGRLIHCENLKQIHDEYKNTFDVGISTLIVKNTNASGNINININTRRRRKMFAYIPINDNFQTDANCTFFEVSKNIEKKQDVKGWTRHPYNYRNINEQFRDDPNFERFNPKAFCIRNGNRNVGILPSRYFYSKPIFQRKYERFTSLVKTYIDFIPRSDTIRGGDV